MWMQCLQNNSYCIFQKMFRMVGLLLNLAIPIFHDTVFALYVHLLLVAKPTSLLHSALNRDVTEPAKHMQISCAKIRRMRICRAIKIYVTSLAL